MTILQYDCYCLNSLYKAHEHLSKTDCLSLCAIWRWHNCQEPRLTRQAMRRQTCNERPEDEQDVQTTSIPTVVKAALAEYQSSTSEASIGFDNTALDRARTVIRETGQWYLPRSSRAHVNWAKMTTYETSNDWCPISNIGPMIAICCSSGLSAIATSGAKDQLICILHLESFVNLPCWGAKMRRRIMFLARRLTSSIAVKLDLDLEPLIEVCQHDFATIVHCENLALHQEMGSLDFRRKVYRPALKDC